MTDPLPRSTTTALEALRTRILAVPPGRHGAEELAESQQLLAEVLRQPAGAQRDAVESLAQSRLADQLRAAGQVQASFQHALDADRLARGGDLPDVRARAALVVGLCFLEVGQREEARRRLAPILDLAQVSPAISCRARMNIAASLRAEGRLAEAAEAFEALLPLRHHLDPELRASVLINSASCLHQLGRVDEARRMLAEAHASLTPESRADLWAWLDAIAAWVESRARNLDVALSAARRALASGRPGALLAVRSSAARAIADVARWHPAPGLRAEAIVALEEVLHQAERDGALATLVDLHQELAWLCEAEADLARAVRHLRTARELEQRHVAQGEALRLEREALGLELVRMQVESDSLRAHQQALAQANRALLAADHARARLLATLAHDLRGPLTSVLAVADLVEPEDPASVRRGLSTLAATVARMVALLDAALAPSTSRSREEVDLAAVARDSTSSFEALAARKGQTILVIADRPVIVRLDRVALGRLVDNLLSNAIKYGPPGGTAWIEVRALAGRADLVVLDQGPGFPGLDPAAGLLYGHQLAARSTGDEASWGLGLHTVYQLIAELGGILALGSRPEGGAAVRVTLPLG